MSDYTRVRLPWVGRVEPVTTFLSHLSPPIDAITSPHIGDEAHPFGQSLECYWILGSYICLAVLNLGDASGRVRICARLFRVVVIRKKIFHPVFNDGFFFNLHMIAVIFC